MTERLICPDCEKPIVEEYAAGHMLGTRCGCPEKHWAEQDRQTRERLGPGTPTAPVDPSTSEPPK